MEKKIHSPDLHLNSEQVQFLSSSALGQSEVKSHFLTSVMHFPLEEQEKDLSGGQEFVVLQSSSVLSPQSGIPSQYLSFGMHCPEEHLNLFAGQISVDINM